MRNAILVLSIFAANIAYAGATNSGEIQALSSLEFWGRNPQACNSTTEAGIRVQAKIACDTSYCDSVCYKSSDYTSCMVRCCAK